MEEEIEKFRKKIKKRFEQGFDIDDSDIPVHERYAKEEDIKMLNKNQIMATTVKRPTVVDKKLVKAEVPGSSSVAVGLPKGPNPSKVPRFFGVGADPCASKLWCTIQFWRKNRRRVFKY